MAFFSAKLIIFLQQSVELRHGLLLDGVHDVDIRPHRFVVVVAGPLHDDVWRDTEGKGIDDEGSAPGMSPDQFILGVALLFALVPLIGDNMDFSAPSLIEDRLRVQWRRLDNPRYQDIPEEYLYLE